MFGAHQETRMPPRNISLTPEQDAFIEPIRSM